MTQKKGNQGGNAKTDIHPSFMISREEWKSDPIGSFQRWASSPLANEGFGYSDRSIKTNSAMWGKFVQFCPREPAMANAEKIEAFIHTLSGRVRNERQTTDGRPSPVPSRRRYLALLDKLFDSLVECGVRRENDAAPLLFALDREQRSLPHPMPIAFSPEEERKLDDVVDRWPDDDWRDARDKALLMLLIGSGIKVGEVRELLIGDLALNFDPPFVRVQGARQERLAPVIDRSIPSLRRWLDIRECTGREDDLLFPGENTPMLSGATIYRLVKTATSNANLNPRHTGPSVLRHTFATRQIRSGKPLETVKNWLGHEQITSTVVYKFMVVNPGGIRPA